MSTSDPINIDNARLSFPRLFTPKSFQEGQPARFEASFLLDPSDAKHAKKIKDIKTLAKQMAVDKWGEVPKGLKVCFGNGNDRDKIYDGYEDRWYLSSANQTRPTVVDKDPNVPLVLEDGKPYGGCWVNGVITLWVQDNQFGKRINANLRAVQFVKDDEAFGVKPIAATDAFDNVVEDDDGDLGGEEGGGESFLD